MDETCRLRRGEGYEVHTDEVEGFYLFYPFKKVQPSKISVSPETNRMTPTGSTIASQMPMPTEIRQMPPLLQRKWPKKTASLRAEQV